MGRRRLRRRAACLYAAGCIAVAFWARKALIRGGAHSSYTERKSENSEIGKRWFDCRNTHLSLMFLRDLKAKLVKT